MTKAPNLDQEAQEPSETQSNSNAIPRFPRKGTRADEALNEIIIAPVNQRDYLLTHDSWRLAASIEKLEELGWRFKTRNIIRPKSRSPIVEYAIDRSHEPNLIALKSRGFE